MAEDFDRVFDLVGGFGWWQIRTLLCLALLEFVLALYSNSILFLQYTPEHDCITFDSINRPISDKLNRQHQENLTAISPAVSLAVSPHHNGTDTVALRSKCHAVVIVDGSPVQAKCQSWRYEMDVMERTVISQFNLVCDESHHLANLHLSTTLGWCIGYIFSGFISDRFGRKYTIIVFALLGASAGLAKTFAPNFVIFLALNFLSSVLLIPVWQSDFVLSVEIVGKRYRKWVGGQFFTISAIAYAGISGVALLLRDWQHMNLLCTLPVFGVVLFYWLIPESPRWLYVRGRVKEAQRELKIAAKLNRTSTTSFNCHMSDSSGCQLLDFLVTNEPSASQPTSVTGDSPCEKLKTNDELLQPSAVVITKCAAESYYALACRASLVSFVWFSSQLVYYGLKINMHTFSGGIFLNTFIAGMLEIPANFVVVFLLYWGRRSTLMLTLLVASACLTVVAFKPEGISWLTSVLVQAGKFSVSITASAVYVYTSELFPTVCRSSLMSLSNMIARLGSVIAPYLLFAGSEEESASRSLTALLIFAVFALLATFVLVLLPETKGKPLPERIEDISALCVFPFNRVSLTTSKKAPKVELKLNEDGEICLNTEHLTLENGRFVDSLGVEQPDDTIKV